MDSIFDQKIKQVCGLIKLFRISLNEICIHRFLRSPFKSCFKESDNAPYHKSINFLLSFGMKIFLGKLFLILSHPRFRNIYKHYLFIAVQCFHYPASAYTTATL